MSFETNNEKDVGILMSFQNKLLIGIDAADCAAPKLWSDLDMKMMFVCFKINFKIKSSLQKQLISS